MRLCILGIFALVLCQEATAVTATDSVVSGRAISNEYMDYVKMKCPKGDICMDAWFRWTIDAEKTLRGPPVTGHITAVRMQHSTVVRAYERRLRLFVLRPIEDPKSRALLRSDYYLVSTSLATASIQGAPVQPTKVYLTISSTGCSVDGHDMDCSDISRYLHRLNLQHGCHILLQRAPYAYVAAALKSLQAAGGLCKIGWIAVAPH